MTTPRGKHMLIVLVQDNNRLMFSCRISGGLHFALFPELFLVEDFRWLQNKKLRIVRSGDLGGHSTVPCPINLLNLLLRILAASACNAVVLHLVERTCCVIALV